MYFDTISTDICRFVKQFCAVKLEACISARPNSVVYQNKSYGSKPKVETFYSILHEMSLNINLYETIDWFLTFSALGMFIGVEPG